MTFDRLRLSKLIELLQRPQDRRVRLIERDAKAHVLKRELGSTSDARDFYIPFWSDAKKSVVDGDFDLQEATIERIEKSDQRKKLYVVLLNNFPIIWGRISSKMALCGALSAGPRISGKPIDADGALVSFGNVLSVIDRRENNLALYPYFSKDVPLGQRHAGLAIAAMLRALPEAANCNVCIADMLRGQVFFDVDYALDGREFAELRERHSAILSEWRTQVRIHARR